MPKDAIFISAGDRETFASYACAHLGSHFDLLVHYYGQDADRARLLTPHCRLFGLGPGGKFNNLQRLYRAHPDILASYDTIWVCDDDIRVVRGHPSMLCERLRAFRLDAIAPAFSPYGRISFGITLPQPGPHFVRIVNFIEMTAPLFRTSALLKFLGAYDGSLDGWGTDCWFLNVLEAQHRKVVGIDDRVWILNPWESEKPQGDREIDRLAPTPERRAQWELARVRHGLETWEHREHGRFAPRQARLPGRSPA